jgi:hypothetical protein
MNKETKKNEKPTENPKPGFKWVKNLMTDKWIQIETNTPLCCDPSSETYWSM